MLPERDQPVYPHLGERRELYTLVGDFDTGEPEPWRERPAASHPLFQGSGRRSTPLSALQVQLTLRSGGTLLDFSKELLRGGDGVDLASVDPLHELCVIAAQSLLHLLLQAVLGPGDDELL